MKLWVVGKNVALEAKTNTWSWELEGIFDDKFLALYACTTDKHWIGPLDLNETVAETIPWPGAWFPKVQDEPIGGENENG